MGQVAFKKLPDAPYTGSVPFAAARVSTREVGAPRQDPLPAIPLPPPGATKVEPARDCRARAAELYREHGPAVYRRCLKLLRSPESARDATQEVFSRLVQNLDRLEERETILPWMYRVATNHCLNHLRDHRRRVEEVSEDAIDLGGPPAAEVGPQRALAHAILSRFDQATQAIAIGILVDEMDHEELAQVMGLSRRTVARKLERFLRSAREIAEEQPLRRPASAAT